MARIAHGHGHCRKRVRSFKYIGSIIEENDQLDTGLDDRKENSWRTLIQQGECNGKYDPRKEENTKGGEDRGCE